MRLFKTQVALIIISAGLIILFFTMVYLPMNAQINVFRSKCRNTGMYIQKVNAQTDRIQELDKKLKELNERMTIYERLVPESRNLGQFLQDMAALMDNYELKDQYIKPGTETNVLKLKCIPVDMKCKGKLKQLFDFYKSLESMDRLIRIESVRFVNDKNFNGEITMETKAAVFYRGPESKG